jgi:hypothetical protein
VHEQKEWRRGEKDNRGSDHGSGHCASVTAAFTLLNGSQWCLFPIYQPHIIDIYLQPEYDADTLSSLGRDPFLRAGLL